MAKSQEAPERMEEITLENDTGANITFTGRLYAEHSFFDEETQALTHQRLYLTNSGDQAYSVVTSDGKSKERRAYTIRREGHLCKINNGLFDVSVNANDLIAVVRGLCGLAENMDYEEFFTDVQGDKDRAVNE